MTNTIPVALFIRLALISQRRRVAVTDKEQVAQHFDFAPLLAVAKQRSNVHAQMLAQQIQQRRFNPGHHVNGSAQIEGLQAAAAGIAVGKLVTHGAQHIFVLAQRFTHHQRRGVFQGLADLFAAGDFANARVPGVIFDDNDITGEVRRVRAAQVHQHAVMPGDRDNLHSGHNWR